MKLSLKTIALELTYGNVHFAAFHSAGADSLRLESLALWDGCARPDRSVCYAVDADRLEADFRCPEGIALVVLGQADPARFAGADADVLIWSVSRRELSFPEQFNRLAGVFRHYWELELELLQRMLDGAGLPELLRLGDSRFRSPMLLLDAGFSLLLRSRPELPPDWESAGPDRAPSLPAETAEQIRISREFLSRGRSGGVFSLSEEILSCPALFIQLRQEQRVYYLAVLQTAQPLTGAHAQLLQIFASLLNRALRGYRFSDAGAAYFDELVGRLLRDERVEPEQILRRLHSLQWKPDDNYLCFVLETDLWQNRELDYAGICRAVQSRFPATAAVRFQDSIVCIANLDRAGLSRDDYLRLLAPYLRDHLLRAGISYAFPDFEAIPHCHRQALTALEFGRQKAPDAWLYRFEQHAMDYFTRYGTSRMPARHLCHPDLLVLERFDRENDTDLLRTLHSYLTCGRNATTAAADLYIHRNTLYQRMSRIESLIEAKLSDPATQLYMQLSFSIVGFDLRPREGVH